MQNKLKGYKKMNESYKIIQHIRDSLDKYYEDNHLEGACFCVDITLYEMDRQFIKPNKKIIDQDEGYEFQR
jgi:hypothetical protein